MALCFRDKTFCSAQCATKECPRHFDDEVQRAADRWWAGLPGPAPIAFGEFHHSCPDYVPASRV